MLTAFYDKDPNRFADAVKYDELTHTEVLAKGLKVMDSTAASLCRDNNIPILVFNLNDPENIIRAAAGEKNRHVSQITIYFQEEKPCKRFMILPMKK